MKDRRSDQTVSTTGADVASGTVTGAVTGAAVGGLAGLLAATVIPGLGAFFIGGPLAAAIGLTGAAAATISGATTGVVAGGLLGALTSFGLSHKEAQAYQDRVNEGAVLVAVPIISGEEDVVEQIFADYNASDVKSVINPRATERRAEEVEQDEESYAPLYTFDNPRPAYARTGMKGGKAKRRTRKVRRLEPEEDVDEG